MNIAGGVIIYLLLWWTVFFAVLPWNVHGSWEAPEKQVKGTDPGAPQDAQVWRKMKRTTWISALAWLVVFGIIQSGVISYRD